MPDMPPVGLSEIRGVLFDKDGTLISFEKTWGPAMGSAIRHYAAGDAALAEALAAVSLFDLETERFGDMSAAIAGTVADFAAGWARHLGVAADQAFFTEVDGLLRHAARNSLAPIGVPHEVLAELVAMRHVCGIATNDAEANAQEQARALYLQDHLSFVVGYDSGHGAKP
ncbi:MAG: HAD family hydrolase, partial [Pseudomonadota bacterium]